MIESVGRYIQSQARRFWGSFRPQRVEAEFTQEPSALGADSDFHEGVTFERRRFVKAGVAAVAVGPIMVSAGCSDMTPVEPEPIRDPEFGAVVGSVLDELGAGVEGASLTLMGPG